MAKNPAAVALGKLAVSKRTREDLAEAGRRGGLKKAANRQNGTGTQDDQIPAPIVDAIKRELKRSALAEPGTAKRPRVTKQRGKPDA